MPGLDQSKVKLDRAKQHVFDLDRAKVAFLASYPYAVTTKSVRPLVYEWSDESLSGLEFVQQDDRCFVHHWPQNVWGLPSR